MMIYQKKNGDLIYRTAKHIPNYKKGDTTSMGWLVIDIQKLYKGKLYSFTEYDSVAIKRLKFNNLTTLLYKYDIMKMLEISLVGVIFYMIIVK